MVEKKISERESLEIISEMLNRTNQDTPVGSGKFFLAGGYILAALSLAAFCISYFLGNSGWGVFGVACSLITVVSIIFWGRPKKKGSMHDTYMTKCIRSVWSSLIGVFAAFTILCTLKYSGHEAWTGLFFLGLILPAYGIHTTGVILRERFLQAFGVGGVMFALFFLYEMSYELLSPSMEWPLVLAFQMLVTLIIPGHILNYKAQKANAK